MSLRWKLVFAIGIPVLLVYGVLIGVQFTTLRETAMAQAQQRAELNAQVWAARVDGRLSGIVQTVEAVAGLLGQAVPGNSLEGFALNEHLLDQSRFISGVGHAIGSTDRIPERSPRAPYSWSRDGERLRSDRADDPDWTTHPWYASALDGKTTWSEPYETRLLSEPIVTVSAPILRGDDVIGVLAADVPLGPLHADVLPLADVHPFRLVSAGGQSIVARGAIDAGSIADSSWSDSVTTPVPTTGWSMAASWDAASILQPVYQQLIRNLIFMGIGLVALLAVVAVTGFRIVQPVRELAKAVHQLGDGQLDVHVEPPPGRDEIGELARGFNAMTSQLKANIETIETETAAREQVEGEMRLARRIQEMLLPEAFPARLSHSEVQIWALNNPARVVAGDFYDVIDHGDRITVVLGDVSGKGAGPAMFMAMARTMIRLFEISDTSLSELVGHLNDQLYPDSHGSMFLTLVILRYEPATGRIEFVNGGHPPPLRIQEGVQPTPVGKPTGPLVGALEGEQWSTLTTTLDPGQGLLLYSDGLTEAVDEQGDQLGLDGLCQLIQRSSAGLSNPDTFCQQLVADIRARECGEAGDDVTALIIVRRGND